eukprot:m.552153 g.552153  ORF g.552153 m.552153 type:complete len:71 (-) comp57738_c0_seq2:134-346(-)
MGVSGVPLAVLQTVASPQGFRGSLESLPLKQLATCPAASPLWCCHVWFPSLIRSPDLSFHELTRSPARSP